MTELVVEPSAPSSTDAAIVTENLGRSFGAKTALDGFDVAIPKGKVTALVGPNGAGKTTLLLILAGLLAPGRGRALVGGFDPTTHPYDVHRSLGWMPDFFGTYDGLTLTEYLELFAALYDVPVAERSARSRELLALVELEDKAGDPVHTLSRGQKQRLGFARTIVHRPAILLLDEPASGLDPRARVALRDLVRDQARQGVSVVVSSHILSELEEMSDLVVFADRGRCRGIFTMDQLHTSGAALGRVWRFRALDAGRLLEGLRSADPDAVLQPDGGVAVTLHSDEAAAETVARLVGEGIKLVEVAPVRGSLEGYFMSMDEGS
ncbi:MAG: ABC transporter ATP-binding protein [Actinomycetota bacterium]